MFLDPFLVCFMLEENHSCRLSNSFVRRNGGEVAARLSKAFMEVRVLPVQESDCLEHLLDRDVSFKDCESKFKYEHPATNTPNYPKLFQ